MPKAYKKKKFTKRERDVAELLIQGMGTREIADVLILEHQTVRLYISQIMKKLKVGSRTHAALKLQQEL